MGAAFTPNIALQPRALIMLGTLTASTDLATTELVQRLSKLLSQTLSSSSASDENEDLGVATLMAMTSIVPHLEDDLS